MKIAINCRFWLPGQLEGVGFFLQEVVNRWLANRPDDVFHLFFDRRPTIDFSEQANVRVHVMFPPARHPILYRLWFNGRLPRRLRRIRPDVFFSPEPLCPLPYAGAQIITVHDLAYLHYPNTFAPRNLAYYKKYMPQFIQEADEIITVSSFTQKDIFKHFPEAAHKVSVARNGCRDIFEPLAPSDIQAFRSAHTENKPYFFYYGSLNARKNIHNLLHGFQQFKENTGASHLLIIGGRKGWRTEELERVYQNHPFRSEIWFTGYLEESLLKNWLGAATALTYISHFEGFGLPVLEAMQSGVPAITTRGSSMEEIADDAGYYVDPDAPEDISRLMVDVIRDEEKRNKNIQLGLKRAEAFSWDRTAASIWEVIERRPRSI
jgi:glycosyltransferase involved in cell wall biosynthesis